MLEPNFFNTVLVIPIVNVLMVFYKLFTVIGIPGAFGFAIIALTILVRLLLNPFFKQQLETTKKMNDIKPHLDRINAKHKGDKKKLQEEQMRLYKEAGINPAAGCLFLIIQMPIFIALYNTLSLMLTNTGTKLVTAVNKALYLQILQVTHIDPWFFGINMALTPSNAKIWYYYAIPVITGALQFLQTKVTMPSTPSPKADEKQMKKKDEKESTGGDFQKAMNTQMKFIFPVMIAWFSLSLPIGLSLYWNIFSLFSIFQYHSMQKAKSKGEVQKT